MSNLDNIKNMIARGDREGAVKTLVSILRLNCNDVDAWLLLGEVIEDPAKKRDCYNQALKISPNNLLALDRLRKLEISKIAPSANSKDKSQGMVSSPGHKVSPNTITALYSYSIDEQVDVQSESITEQSTLVDGEIPLVCPRCGHINNLQSKICVHCFYTLVLVERKRNPNNSATPPPVSVTSNNPVKYVPSTKNAIPSQTSKPSCGTYVVLGIIVLCLISLLGQCMAAVEQNNTSHVATADPQEQAAIDAIQNQSTVLASNMHESIAVILVILENEGHTQSIDGWYVSKGSGYYSVTFYFYLDGNREYAEWWYYPDTGSKIPKNDWAFAFMGE